MSIPNFKSQHDREAFMQIFNEQWLSKKEMLNHVKNDLFREYVSWDQLHPRTLEVINDIVSYLAYDCERQFEETHQNHNTEDEEIGIPRHTVVESEVLTPRWVISTTQENN